mgnify:CR=1 FL=1
MQIMRKMKDSGIEWIGEVPERWETQKLKYYATVTSGEILSKDEYVFSGDIPVIGSNGKIGTTYKSNNHSEVITTGRVGTIGTAQIVQDAWITDNALIIKSHSISRPFLTYVIPNFDFKFMLSGTAQPLITATKLKNQYIPVPSSEVQDKLVQYLNTQIFNLSHLISQVCSSIELYKKFKQAVITQAVTKGVRGEREMKDSGVEWIGEIPKEWVCEKIKYATSISRGLFNHRPRNDERYYNGKYPFIQTGDVANATKYIVSYSQTLNELGKSVSKEFPKGTLTMTIAANVGDVAILNFNAYFPDSVVGFIPNKNIRTLYLFYVFSAMKDEFTRTAIKSTQLNLNIDRVKETFIPVTLNVNEQCEIENYLESKCAEIDGLIAKKEQLVKELESYKKSLIYEVVTGKREV